MLNNKFTQKGSIMVEALAMLGLIAMVTPVLYRKAAERTTELQDINVASQIRMVSAAVDAYLKDNYSNVGGDISAAGTVLTSGNTHYENIKNYLPAGFDLGQASKLFEDFQISVKKGTATDLNGITHDVFTSAVVANLRDNMTRMRAAKIATMIGANGGIISQDGDDYKLNGTQGSWEAYGNSGFNFGWTAANHPRDNSLVSISNEAISSAVGDVDSTEALYRVAKGNDVNKNTMQTELYMGGHDIRQVAMLVANGTANSPAAGGAGTVTIGSATNNGNLFVRGSAEIGSFVRANDVFANHTLTAPEAGLTNVSGTTASYTNVYGNLIAATRLTSTHAGLVNVSGTNASFNNITGVTKVISPLVAATYLTSTHAGLTNVSGNNASFDSVTGRTRVISPWVGATGLSAQDAWLTGVSGESADFTSIDATYLTAEHAGLTNVSGTNAYYTNVYANSVNATGVTADDGNFNRLHARSQFTVGGDEITDHTLFQIISSTLTSSTNQVNFDNTKFHVDATDEVLLRATNNDSRGRLEITPSTVSMIANNDQELVLNSSGLRHGSGVTIDNSGLAVSASETSAARYAAGFTPSGDGKGSPILDRVSNSAQPNVVISRNGIIELAAPSSTDGTGGYVRARRLVSDVEYPFRGVVGADVAGGAVKSDGTNATSGYQYYEVNPAYTSVMNDIKLASRGGARLSDILPDYINKGIYVADNTYGDIGASWLNTQEKAVDPAGFTAADACAGCLASPWLGFIPAPQCPPAYDKVITLEPMRFKMAEIFTIDKDLVPSNLSSLYPTTGTNVNASHFKLRQIAALDAEALSGGSFISSTTITVPSLNSPVNVEIEVPRYLQTNTWLNTTVEPYYGNGTDEDVAHLQGWHTVMGFIYPMNGEYNEIYTAITGENPPDNYAWNLFPVFEQENAAVARVYCSFNRVDNNSPVWNNDVVYYYDQMDHNPGYVKTTTWSGVVNDPDLDYDDAW